MKQPYRDYCIMMYKIDNDEETFLLPHANELRT